MHSCNPTAGTPTCSPFRPTRTADGERQGHALSCRRGAIDEPEPLGAVAEQHEHRLGCELADRRVERQEPVLLCPIDRPGVPAEQPGAALILSAVVSGAMPHATVENH